MDNTNKEIVNFPFLSEHDLPYILLLYLKLILLQNFLSEQYHRQGEKAERDLRFPAPPILLSLMLQFPRSVR